MAEVYGQIDPDGGIVRNSGGIAGREHPGTGRYTVKFKPGIFTSEPVVVATAMTREQKCGRSGTSRFISITHAAPDEVCFGVVKSDDDAGESSNRGFSFIALGN